MIFQLILIAAYLRHSIQLTIQEYDSCYGTNLSNLNFSAINMSDPGLLCTGTITPCMKLDYILEGKKKTTDLPELPTTAL